MGNAERVEVTDGDLGGGGMDEELMLGEIDLVWFLRRVHDSVCALLQRFLKLSSISLGSLMGSAATHQRHNLSRLGLKFMGEFLVVGNQMGDIHVAEILFHEDVLSYLISVAPLVP